jgi:hypothetical protein
LRETRVAQKNNGTHTGRIANAKITVGLAPVEWECYRMWAIVVHQEGPRMILAGKEAAEKTKEQAALAGIVAALTWEHPRERVADPVQWAPRMIVYPEEAERVMEIVQAGKWHTLPPEHELIGQQIASPREGWARNVYLSMLGYEEARRQDPRVDSGFCPSCVTRFPLRRFQGLRVQWHRGDGLDHRALVRCSQPPLWGQTK